MYIPKYFTLNECFPPNFPKKSWQLMDARILQSADTLREVFGPLWCNGHGLTQCGFRTNGSLYSQHRFGRAMDLHSEKHSARKIRRFILGHPEMFPYITFLEADIPWIHVDCRNTIGVKLWSPERGFLKKE